MKVYSPKTGGCIVLTTQELIWWLEDIKGAKLTAKEQSQPFKLLRKLGGARAS